MEIFEAQENGHNKLHSIQIIMLNKHIQWQSIYWIISHTVNWIFRFEAVFMKWNGKTFHVSSFYYFTTTYLCYLCYLLWTCMNTYMSSLNMFSDRIMVWCCKTKFLCFQRIHSQQTTLHKQIQIMMIYKLYIWALIHVYMYISR